MLVAVAESVMERSPDSIDRVRLGAPTISACVRKLLSRPRLAHARRPSADVAAVHAARADAPAVDTLRVHPDDLAAHELLRRRRIEQRLPVAPDLQPADRPRLDRDQV